MSLDYTWTLNTDFIFKNVKFLVPSPLLRNSLLYFKCKVWPLGEKKPIYWTAFKIAPEEPK